MRNLEKIAKIAVLRIEKEDTQSILYDLDWLEDNFIHLIRLKDKDLKSFKEIIDPKNRYQKKEFESVPWESIDWTKVDTSKITITRHPKLNEDDQRYRKAYNSTVPPDETDLLGKYIEAVFIIWNKATVKSNFSIQKRAAIILANWIAVLDRQSQDLVDFNQMIKFFLESSTALNQDLLETKDEKPQSFHRLLSYNLYLDQIFAESPNPLNSSLYFEYLFRNIHLSFRTNRLVVPKEFIERCINSNYYPTTDFTKYADLYSLFDDHLDQHRTHEQRTAQLKELSDFGFYKIRYIKTQEEYKSWEKEFDNYLAVLGAILPFTQEISEKKNKNASVEVVKL